MQGVSGKALVLLAFSALGVIYGDIGTSPLYSYQTVFTMTEASHDQVLGSASLFFWTLTLIVLVKYVGVVLRADDNGEGGLWVGLGWVQGFGFEVSWYGGWSQIMRPQTVVVDVYD